MLSYTVYSFQILKSLYIHKLLCVLYIYSSKVKGFISYITMYCNIKIKFS